MSKSIDQFIKWIGRSSAWLNPILILFIVLDVTLRYIFSNTQNWVIELEWHLFAIIFLVGASYALQKDQHVRVDLFYQHYSEKTKAWLTILGHLFLLFPWIIVVVMTSYKYAYNSFTYNEVSPNPGGLPMRYIIKFMIVIGFLLLGVQAIGQLIESIKLLTKREN